MSAQLPVLLLALGAALSALALFAPHLPPPRIEVSALLVPPELPAKWPLQIDPRAAGCSASVRMELAEALAALDSAWADALLRQAFAEEPDAAVRAAIAAGLSRSSNQSLVT
jgi:hypothetical protein